MKIFLLYALLLLSGCTNLSNRDVAALAGGMVGAAIGSQFAHRDGQLISIAIGTLGGALSTL